MDTPALSQFRTLSVVMPAYNEAARIRAALDAFEGVPPPTGLIREIIVVDDGSTDGTAQAVRALAAERPDIRIVEHAVNQGKGAAIRTGLRSAAGDVVLIHDADLEYDPRDHAAALRPILEGKADAVIGSRFIGAEHRVLYYWHSVANRLITWYSNVATNLNLTDIECCTKAFTREVIDRIDIQENRFGVEPELIARLSRLRLQPGDRRVRVYEVAVSYAGRTYAEGKKIGWKDGLRALYAITKYAVVAHNAPPARG